MKLLPEIEIFMLVLFLIATSRQEQVHAALCPINPPIAISFDSQCKAGEYPTHNVSKNLGLLDSNTITALMFIVTLASLITR